MTRRAQWLFLLILALGCASAAIVLFFALPRLQAPRVLAVEPADGAQDILPTAPITITFSAPMNAVETEKSIRFQPRVNGAFAWRDNQTVTFTPRTTLPISTTIRIQIQDARSSFGRAMEQTAQTRFTTLPFPRVIDSTPALDAQFVYIPTHVVLTFNRAMNSNAIYNHLVVTPTLANQTLVIDENNVTLGGFFQPRTRYEIRLAAKSVDEAYGIPMEHDLVWNFTTAEQYPNLSVLERERVMEFSAQDSVNLPIQFTNVSRLDAALYALSQKEFDTNATAPFETRYAFQPGSAPVKTQRVATNAALDQYTTQNIVLDALPAGNYLLVLTAPEGASDTKLLRVE